MSATSDQFGRLIMAPGVHVAAIELALLWLSLRGCSAGGRTQSGMALYRSGKGAGSVDFFKYDDTIRVDVIRSDGGCTRNPPVHCVYSSNTQAVFELICQLMDHQSTVARFTSWVYRVIPWVDEVAVFYGLGNLSSWTWRRVGADLARLSMEDVHFWAFVARVGMYKQPALVLVGEAFGTAEEVRADTALIERSHQGSQSPGQCILGEGEHNPAMMLDAFAGILLQYGAKMEGGQWP